MGYEVTEDERKRKMELNWEAAGVRVYVGGGAG